ncbi:hypothetical protein L202_06509 [Cryptococcus amylolentus CBS 6039]|uniref:Uncharacterized protein n=1 Tax=Cryptococcus amylolentus CBS 6039 TaxID=1295533 RepID=A0A1E3HG44_9TREE|nr:hypothetical protein L202_06509 [Cryptococcus amylolentus CBS 6039]ODN75333.1 hypothetical protein L202_06509 [Cryptococcus amylolentus CBS 6039]
MPPFLPTLGGLRDLTTTINPYALFSPEHHTDTPPPHPGPSTPPQPSPAPSLSSSGSAPSRSSLGADGRRKSSGTSVMIAEPEVTGMSRGRRRRTQSTKAASSGFQDAFADRRGRKQPLDTYIIVKPPPAAAKNPLNLQIQLVVKRNRPRGVSTSSNYSSAAPSTPRKERDGDLSDNSPVSTTPTSSQFGLPSSPASAISPSSEAGGVSLKRSQSVKSSMSTATSSTTSGASGKRIEPMFNLAVHSVVHPTVVTDAATDVKVAKFLKRGVDVVGVGIVEPAEVYSSSSDPTLYPITSHATSDTERSEAPRRRPLSVASYNSANPLSDDGASKSGIRASLDLKGFNFDSLRVKEGGPGGENGAKKLFGKIFRKKKTAGDDEGASSTAMRRSASVQSADVGAISRVSASETMPHPASKPNNQTYAGYSDSHLVPSTTLAYPTFGTSPSVIVRPQAGDARSPCDRNFLRPELPDKPPTSPTLGPSNFRPSGSRPIGYTWTVRRWARRNSEGWSAHLVAAASAGLEMVGALDLADEHEVQFEWIKGSPNDREDEGDFAKSRGLSALGRARGISTDSRASATTSFINSDRPRSFSPSPVTPNELSGASNPPSPFSSRPQSPAFDPRPDPIRRVSHAASAASSEASRQPSISFEDTSSINGGGGDTTADEDATSEDPEDSEVPWSCWVWVKGTGQRQLLGTLVRAPHHPKVIGVLKIPVSLDAVSLTDVKRQPASSGDGAADGELGTAVKKVKESVALTEENLKDMVCVTGLWLVAREDFGGLARAGKIKGRRRQ